MPEHIEIRVAFAPEAGGTFEVLAAIEEWQAMDDPRWWHQHVHDVAPRRVWRDLTVRVPLSAVEALFVPAEAVDAEVRDA